MFIGIYSFLRVVRVVDPYPDLARVCVRACTRVRVGVGKTTRNYPHYPQLVQKQEETGENRRKKEFILRGVLRVILTLPANI